MMLTWTLAACGPSEPEGASEARIAEWHAQVAATEAEVDAHQQAWHRALSAALAAEPPTLGAACAVAFAYPSVDYGQDAWVKPQVSKWSADAQATRAAWAAARVRRARDELEKPPPIPPSSVDRSLKDLARLRTPEFWAPELTVLTLAKRVPVQGDDGKYLPGTLVVRALLYDYGQDRVVCQGMYEVGNADTIAMSFDTWGTERELREQEERVANHVPDAALMSEIVELDLMKKAFHEAPRQLREVAPVP
ncbi:MAG: hypothetical protein H6735_14080 [Alphaproteobacteria bacterium]|nr:hypothetical protein [Alphaproteobacteria bacterium]